MLSAGDGIWLGGAPAEVRGRAGAHVVALYPRSNFSIQVIQAFWSYPYICYPLETTYHVKVAEKYLSLIGFFNNLHLT